MSSTAIVTIVIIAAVLLLAVAAFSAWRARRRSALRSRFGSEYDHAVDTAPNRRTAERELTDRTRRRDELDIQPLTSAAAMRYRDEWQVVQQQFVDTPAEAVGRANNLVTTVMNERGYPTRDDDERGSMLSVDHADVMDRYRVAQRTESTWRASGTTDTEDLRQAMKHYRAVFERLVSDTVDAYPAEETTTRRRSRNDVTS